MRRILKTISFLCYFVLLNFYIKILFLLNLRIINLQKTLQTKKVLIKKLIKEK